MKNIAGWENVTVPVQGEIFVPVQSEPHLPVPVENSLSEKNDSKVLKLSQWLVYFSLHFISFVVHSLYGSNI